MSSSHTPPSSSSSSSSIHDLLANLTSERAQYSEVAAPPETWRVCFIVPSAAKLWRDDRELLLGLSQHGFEVHVIAHDEGVFDQMLASGIRTCTMPSPRGSLWRAGLLIPVLYPIVQGYLIEHPPTLIHVEEEPLLCLTLLATRLLESMPLLVGTTRGKPALPEEMSHALEQGIVPETLVEPLRHVYWQQILERLDIFLTTSRDELERIMARTSSPAHRKLEVWPGASGYDARHVDPERRDLPSRQELRQMGEIPGSWRYLVGVAGDIEQDLDALEALISNDASMPDGVGWLIAKPATSSRYGDLLEARLGKMHDRVMLLEPGELGMPLFLALCDLLYVPRTRSHRIATIALEAQAMGIPCIVHDVGLNHVYVEKDQTGVVLPAGASLERVREAIAFSLQDEARRDRWSRAAMKRARTLFSRQSAHEQLMSLYDRLLSRRYG